jgi:hypothetical protein
MNKTSNGFKRWLLILFVCTAAPGLSAEVSYIPARDYGATLISHINSAKRSVSVYMYLIALNPGRASSQTTQIADALASAAQRGAAVEVVLDKSALAEGRPEAVEEDNHAACRWLASQGVKVFVEDTTAILHAKAVVIDSVTVIAGSANFSESAMKSNFEISLLVQSRETALAILADMAKMPRKRFSAQDTLSVEVPIAFLIDTSYVGRMAGTVDERAFDAYLYLCTKAHAKKVGSFDLDYSDMAASLGIDSMQSVDYRRQINKTLVKLQDDYRLCRVAQHWGKNAEVTLTTLTKGTVAVPEEYWNYGWQKRLGFAAKVMEITGMYYSDLSTSRPHWSMAVTTIATSLGVSPEFVATGTVELRRANLLDVEYSEIPKNPNEQRKPNIYTPLPLYDPRQLDAAWQDLEKRYGKDILARATDCAALVYKDCDWRAVEQFIGLEQTYGRARVEQAKSIIAQKSPDNPKRTVGYFIGTVKNLK